MVCRSCGETRSSNSRGGAVTILQLLLHLKNLGSAYNHVGETRSSNSSGGAVTILQLLLHLKN
jgi:hypothetical protein